MFEKVAQRRLPQAIITLPLLLHRLCQVDAVAASEVTEGLENIQPIVDPPIPQLLSL